MAKLVFTVKKPHELTEYGPIRSVTVPAGDGAVEILPGHGSMVAETEPGVCIIENEKGTQTLELHSGGILKIEKENAVLIL